MGPPTHFVPPACSLDRPGTVEYWPPSPTKRRIVPDIPAAQSPPERVSASPQHAISHARPILSFSSGTFAKYMIVLVKKNKPLLRWTTSKLSHWRGWENFSANR